MEFPDGSIEEFSSNIIFENLYSQIDDDGRTPSLFRGIIDYKKDSSAVPKSDGWTSEDLGQRKRVITTRGWFFLVEWDDGTSNWVPLAQLKESNPVELADFVVSRNIEQEPALAWWVPQVLRKRKHIIKQVTHRIPKKQLKFGIMVPGSVKEALELD